MIFKELGNTGERLSAIGIGTWKLGRNTEGEKEAIAEGLRLGVNFIDTAEMYNTEELVGSAIRGRDGLFIATKVSPHHFRYDDVIRSCSSSLAKLGLTSIDLYQLHWPNKQVPIAETMKAMERLVKDGKIRHIGVSNFSVEELKEAMAAMKSNDIVSNQVEYSVFVRDPQEGLVPFCAREKISIIAYSPFASGKMFGASRREALETLDTIGKKYKKSAAQVALNWLMSKKGVIPIPKAANASHMRENAESADFKLSKGDIGIIDRIGSNGITPLASKANRLPKKTASLLSKLMEKREKLRARHWI